MRENCNTLNTDSVETKYIPISLWHIRRTHTHSHVHKNTCAIKCQLQISERGKKLESFFLFSRGPATLNLAVSVSKSVGRSVRPPVRPSHFLNPSGFRITAPAQSSATGLPCIRPCYLVLLLPLLLAPPFCEQITDKEVISHFLCRIVECVKVLQLDTSQICE